VIFLDLYTKGYNYYNNFIFNIFISNDIKTLKTQSANEYYKIIYFQSGTSQITLNNNGYILAGSHILCLNEKDDFVLSETPENAVSILYFKPSVINSKFDLSNSIFSAEMSISEMQDVEYLAKFRYDVTISSKIIQLNAIESSIISQKFQQIAELLISQSTSFWPCRSRSNLFEILFLLERPSENKNSILNNAIESSFSKLTVEVIYYLQTSYNQKITTEKLAQAVHTNRTTLLSDFKKNTGLSINLYLTQLRMKMATTLLRDTELNINEICMRTGFSDISYFSKSFKKEIKFTPSEFRRIYAKN